MESAKPAKRPVIKWIKVALDTILLVLLALMYRKNAIGISFHEIGGLALISLFLIHHLFNAPWIAAVTPHVFAKARPGKARFQFVLGVLLLLSILCVGVSGALISKIVFSFRAGGAWKTLHYFSSALALILSGVHAGLHAGYLLGFLKRKGKALRSIAAVALAAVFAFGCYSIAATSFTAWLILPFSQQALEGRHEDFGALAGVPALPETATVGTSADPADGDIPGGDPAAEHGAANAPSAVDGEDPGGGSAAYPGGGKRQDNGNAAGQRRHDGSGKGGAGSFGSAVMTALSFASIAVVFAALTAAVEALLRKNCAKKNG